MFNRAEKQKVEASSQVKALLKPAPDAVTSDVAAPASIVATNELTSQLEDDLKQQKAAMAQKRLSELQGRAVTPAAGSTTSNLLSRIRLVRPSVSQ